MTIHLSTGLQFNTQKEAKIFFGNHRYRRKGDIHFTNYQSPVANDRSKTILSQNN